jgi:hypothetical protein
MVLIRSKEAFNKKVDDVVHIITEVLEKQIDEKKPNPYQ